MLLWRVMSALMGTGRDTLDPMPAADDWLIFSRRSPHEKEGDLDATALEQTQTGFRATLALSYLGVG